jgi:hypothetical protein
MPFQNIIGARLAQVEMPTSYLTVYTTPLNSRTIIKNIDVCNTTSSPVRFYIHLVQSGQASGVMNALFYNAPINANSTLQWTGSDILNEADIIQVKASAAGVTVTITGGEAT